MSIQALNIVGTLRPLRNIYVSIRSKFLTLGTIYLDIVSRRKRLRFIHVVQPISCFLNKISNFYLNP